MEDSNVVPFGPASHIPLASWSSKHRYTLAFFLAGAVAVTLGACGGSGSTNPPATRPSTTAPSPSTPTSKPSVRAAVDDHPYHRGTRDDGPAHDRPATRRGTHDDGPAYDHPHRRGTDDRPAHDDIRAQNRPRARLAAATAVGRLDVIDTLGLDRGRNRPRCRPDRWRGLPTSCTVSPSSSGDMETGRRTGVAAGDDRPRPPDWGREGLEPERREAVRTQIESAARALDGLVTSAPDDASRRAASSSAAALRGLMFAGEADRLLRSREKSPTADELAQADDAQRVRARELDTALDVLTKQVEREENAASTQGGRR